jgi:hypothetical protein
MDSEFKKKAAIAGALYYLKAEEEKKHGRPIVTAKIPNPWQLHGRQSMMHMKNLIQRRVLKRI